MQGRRITCFFYKRHNYKKHRAIPVCRAWQVHPEDFFIKDQMHPKNKVLHPNFRYSTNFSKYLHPSHEKWTSWGKLVKADGDFLNKTTRWGVAPPRCAWSRDWRFLLRDCRNGPFLLPTFQDSCSISKREADAHQTKTTWNQALNLSRSLLPLHGWRNFEENSAISPYSMMSIRFWMPLPSPWLKKLCNSTLLSNVESFILDTFTFPMVEEKIGSSPFRITPEMLSFWMPLPSP